jgi:prevent-host-death family protein
MKRIAASEFRARWSEVIDDVRATREPVLVTKRGKPIVKIVSAESKSDDDIFGFMSDECEIVGDIEAPIVEQRPRGKCDGA